MEQEMEREIQVDVMLSTTDQRDFVSFYSLEKNPRQKFLFLGALFVGFVIILLRDTSFPIWLSFAMGIIMIVLLSFIWRQRSKASRIAQEPWIVKNRLTLVTLGENGVVEIDPIQAEEDDEYDLDEDDEDYCEDEDENCICEDEEADDEDEGEDGGKDDEACQRGDSHDDDGGTVEEDRPTAGKIVRSGKWREFPGAYENSRYFYVFLNDVEAFILQKNRMKESLIPEIRMFLAEKMGDRFRAAK